MKYMKLFNESKEEYYKQIDTIGFLEAVQNPLDISDSTINKIEKIFENFDWKFKINTGSKPHTLLSVSIDIEYEKIELQGNCLFRIIETDDYWFYVSMKWEFYHNSDITYYKCDGLDGLQKLIYAKNIFLNFISNR